MNLESGGRYLYIGETLPKSEYEIDKNILDYKNHFQILYKKWKKIDYVKFKRCKNHTDFFHNDFKKMILASNASEKLFSFLGCHELDDIPARIKINLQARYVVYAIHKYHKKPYSQYWDNYLGKQNWYNRR